VRITKNLEGFTPDSAINVLGTPEAHALCLCLLQHESGCALARSSGCERGGSRRHGQGYGALVIPFVTILCDFGTRYQSETVQPEFLREKTLPVPGLAGTVAPQSIPGVFE